MNVQDITSRKTPADTVEAYGMTLTRVEATEYGRREAWTGEVNGVAVHVSRNGSGWYVGTYMSDVPRDFDHHRVVYMAIPNKDRREAFNLGLSILAAVNEDVRYETTKRGHLSMNWKDAMAIQDAALAAGTAN